MYYNVHNLFSNISSMQMLNYLFLYIFDYITKLLDLINLYFRMSYFKIY